MRAEEFFTEVRFGIDRTTLGGAHLVRINQIRERSHVQWSDRHVAYIAATPTELLLTAVP